MAMDFLLVDGAQFLQPPRWPPDFHARRASPATSVTRKTTRKTKKRTCAMEAAPAAMPVKPKSAATSATMKKMSAQVSMDTSLYGWKGGVTEDARGELAWRNEMSKPRSAPKRLRAVRTGGRRDCAL